MQPRVVWVKPLPYEVNIDETTEIIEALVNDLVDPKAPYFGTYDGAKGIIELEIKLQQVVNKGKRRIAKRKTSTPLMLTKSKGEDVEEVENEEELEKEEEPVNKKGKVIITKPPKPSIAVFTRRSRKKGSEVVLNKLPPTF